MTPHVQAKIRTQNSLRRTIHQNWREWIDARREDAKTVS